MERGGDEATVGQVVRRVASVRQAVDIGPSADQKVHQVLVLEVYCQVKGRPAIALLLREKRRRDPSETESFFNKLYTVEHNY